MIKNIIIIILILGFIGVVVMLDIPGVQGVLDLRKQIQNEKDKFIAKQDFSNHVLGLIESYNENQETVNEVKNIFPSEEDIPQLIAQLESLAFGSGLILESIDIETIEQGIIGKTEQIRAQQGTEKREYSTVEIKLGLIGDYSAFKNLLGLIESNIRLIDINSIEFISERTEGFSFFKFSLGLKAYYEKQ